MGGDIGLTAARKEEERLISRDLTFKSCQFIIHYIQANSFVGNYGKDACSLQLVLFIIN